MKFQFASLGLLASIAVAAPIEERSVGGLVESNKLRRVIYRSELLKKAKTLEGFAYASPDRNRYIGTPGHQATIDWLVETTSALNYYNVTTQDFNVSLPDVSYFVDGAPGNLQAMTNSPFGHATAPVASVANLGCDDTDYPDLTGKIALIERGECNFALKSALSGNHGAVAALIYNKESEPGTLYGTLGDPIPEGPFVITGGLNRTDGQAILASITAGTEVIVDLTVDEYIVTTTNVIAETLSGDHDNVIHLGAHSDSVDAGPGINDNGSGSLGILEVAVQLAKFTVNNAVRFSWWAAEEEGLLGAEYYVSVLPEEEREKIRLYLNFDMIASPNFYYGIYDGDGSAFGTAGAPGSAEAEKLFADFFDIDEDIPHASSEFDGRSDYGPFLDVGIACGGLDTGAEGIKTEEEAAIFGGTAGIAYDINYHGPGDDVGNLAVGAFLHNTKAIAHATATYARSFDSLPPKTKRVVKKAEGKTKQYVGPKALW